MRLYHRNPPSVHEEKIFFHFYIYNETTHGLGEWRSATSEEITHIQQMMNRLQTMAERVLGVGKSNFRLNTGQEQGSCLIFETTFDSDNDSIDSLIGWIELFMLEPPPSPPPAIDPFTAGLLRF